MEKKIQGDFIDILKNALAEMREGKIEFRGPTEGFVSVIFIEGDILLIDSTWGTGNDELQRIRDWKNGTCILKDITPEERKILVTKWQRHVVLEETRNEPKGTILLDRPVAVQALLRNFKRESLDLDALCAEIKNNKYSGEARISTRDGDTSILFYRGDPILSSRGIGLTMRDVITIMDVPEAIVNFYILGDELTRAFSSVLQGRAEWQGLSATVFHFEKMLDKLMEKRPTGHLCIHKEEGNQHYVFFSRGKPLGAYNVDDQWTPLDIATIWEGADHIDYYLSGNIESLLTTVTLRKTADDLQDFIVLWNGLLESMAKKISKKTIEKSLQKNFQVSEFYMPEGITLQLQNVTSQSAEDAAKAFKQSAPGFLKEMAVIVGNDWLGDQLSKFAQWNEELLKQLSLTEVFVEEGQHALA
jgi:hypothetical protein